jgi:hypothetical protein
MPREYVFLGINLDKKPLFLKAPLESDAKRIRIPRSKAV